MPAPARPCSGERQFFADVSLAPCGYGVLRLLRTHTDGRIDAAITYVG